MVINALSAQAREVPGVKIFRFESSLYYANCEHFMERLFHRSGVNPRDMRAQQVLMQRQHNEKTARRRKNNVKQIPFIR